jgi:hypothetical protein
MLDARENFRDTQEEKDKKLVLRLPATLVTGCGKLPL